MIGRKVGGTKNLVLGKSFFPRQDGGNGPCYDLKTLTEVIGRAKGEVFSGMDGVQQLNVKLAFSFRTLLDGSLCIELHYEHPPIEHKPQPENPEHHQLRRLIAKHPQLARQLVQGN